MKLLTTATLAAFLACVPPLTAQGQSYDSAAVARIIDEGTNRSQAMQTLNYLTNVIGPRLTGSKGYRQAVQWTMRRMDSLGMKNVHVEGWGPFVRGWELKTYGAMVMEPQTFPLQSYPEAWSPSLKGIQTADVVYLDADSLQDLQKFSGKLKGKFVLINKPRGIPPDFSPAATRLQDSTLLRLSNASGSRPQWFKFTSRTLAAIRFNSAKLDFCLKEGALAILNASPGADGNILVADALAPIAVDKPFSQWIWAWDVSAPRILPQIAVVAEEYNRLVAMIKAGLTPRLRMELRADFTPPDSGWNVIGEIPGTDLKDEVVIIGAHLDSWHGGTGATDDGTGVTACLEAARIIHALGLHPRRTIRVALWDGEEEGLLGSRAYVEKHFGSQDGDFFNPSENVTLKPEAEKLQVYFNDDNGAGKFRGIYLQGNEAAWAIFRGWLRPFAGMGASTISPAYTGGTDHLSFDAIGLPAFQFIQDRLDYMKITHHFTMDVYERVPEEDMKQAATIMAAFAYNAAMMEGKFPGKQIRKTGK